MPPPPPPPTLQTFVSIKVMQWLASMPLHSGQKFLLPVLLVAMPQSPVIWQRGIGDTRRLLATHSQCVFVQYIQQKGKEQQNLWGLPIHTSCAISTDAAVIQ